MLFYLISGPEVNRIEAAPRRGGWSTGAGKTRIFPFNHKSSTV